MAISDIVKRIWVPRNEAVGFRCHICGEEFRVSDRDARDRHVAKCSVENHDALVQAFNEARPSEFFQPFDPEYAEWAKAHGRIG